MSVLTDTLLEALQTLLADASLIPASNVRAFEALMIGAIGTLEAQGRGNRFFTGQLNGGPPDASLGMEGDLYVATDTRDFWTFVDGEWVFLFNAAGSTGNFDPFEVPLTLRDWVADPARVWFGPVGGEAIYLQDTLPGTAVAGMNWDDPDANVAYVVKPVAFANGTVITCQRQALLAP